MPVLAKPLNSICYYYGMIEKEIKLSKWWKTPSAKAAMRRAIAKKKERHAKWLKGLKAYKAKQHAEIFGEGVK